MKPSFAVTMIVLLGGWLLFWLGCGQSPSETADAASQAVPQRIISLAPSLTQAVFAVGAGERLVGRSEYCNYPSAALAVQSVGRIDLPNFETMIQLKPDLVFATGLTPVDVTDRLENFGLRVERFDFTGLEGIQDDLRKTGRLLDVEAEAAEVVAHMTARLERVRARVGAAAQGAKPKLVILYSLDGLYSSGQGTFPDDLIQIAGAENIAATAPSPWPQLSLEAILLANPDVIFITYDGSELEAARIQERVEILKSDPIWSQVTAIQQAKVYPLLDDYLSIPSARSLNALDAICDALYPR